MDYEVLEVHILPLQSDQFSTSQTGEGVQFCRRSKGFWQFFEQCPDLFGRQDIGWVGGHGGEERIDDHCPGLQRSAESKCEQRCSTKRSWYVEPCGVDPRIGR